MGYNLRQLLNRTRDLMGIPPGEIFDEPRYTEDLNNAQRQLVRETSLFKSSTTIPMVTNQTAYSVPSDFLDFDQVSPYWSLGSDFQDLLVISSADLKDKFPNWRDSNSYPAGKPTTIRLEYGVDGARNFEVFVSPDATYSMVVPYIQSPDALTAPTSLALNGVAWLNEFVPLLAEKVAADYITPRNPELGAIYNTKWINAIREVRYLVRHSNQRSQILRVRTE